MSQNIPQKPTRLWPKGQKWAEYNEIVRAGTTLDDLLARDYWVHVENQLRPMDVISCVAEDGSFDVDLRVLSRTPTEIKFRIIRGGNLDTASVFEALRNDLYVVQQSKSAGTWLVREKSTGKVVADGLDREGAETEKRKLDDVHGGGKLKKAA